MNGRKDIYVMRGGVKMRLGEAIERQSAKDDQRARDIAAIREVQAELEFDRFANRQLLKANRMIAAACGIQLG